MKKATTWKLILIAATGLLGGIIGYKIMDGEILAPIAAVILTLICCGVMMKLNSASVVSDPKKLKDTDDYQKALSAWLSEDSPFSEEIKIALNQLDSLERKQKALKNILDSSDDNPFLTTAEDVERYILANTKRFINRVMIYDGVDQRKFEMHSFYLKTLLRQNEKVLSDFENLILEVAQIGDDSITDTPCLRELTDALRSVREPLDIDASENADDEEPELPQRNAAPQPPVNPSAPTAVSSMRGNPQQTGFTPYGEQYRSSQNPNQRQRMQ